MISNLMALGVWGGCLGQSGTPGKGESDVWLKAKH